MRSLAVSPERDADDLVACARATTRTGRLSLAGRAPSPALYLGGMTVDPETDAAPVRVDGLDDLTREWRKLQFTRLGFENADEMARSDGDWHEAAALLAAGASLDQVTKILL